MLKPPANVSVIEWPTSTLWFDDEGIIHAVTKKTNSRTLEQTEELVEDFKELLNGKKACLLIDVTYSEETTPEVREYVAKEFPKFIKAIAMISNSALGKMVANIFFTIKTQPYPTKFFNDEEEARKWLRQYL